jgi:hypothetical protein
MLGVEDDSPLGRRPELRGSLEPCRGRLERCLGTEEGDRRRALLPQAYFPISQKASTLAVLASSCEPIAGAALVPATRTGRP